MTIIDTCDDRFIHLYARDVAANEANRLLDKLEEYEKLRAELHMA